MIRLIASYKSLAIGILILGWRSCYSQYTEADLVNRIADYQIKADEFYDAGLFPSQRTWSFSSEPVNDNTIFFTASIVSTLRMIQDKLESENRKVVDQIVSKSIPTFSKYQNRDGEVTYNFWQTIGPDLPFPNGSKLISNEKMRLPDDFDTSTLIALSLDARDNSIMEIRKRMLEYSARVNRDEVKLYTLKEYEDLPAFETWFGREMPQAFDLNVISNVLFFVFQNKFELTNYDSASIQLVNQVVLNKHHLQKTKDVSFHSNSAALLLYHISRLISVDNDGFFDEIKEQVISDLMDLELLVKNEVEKAMIHSSLYRLNQTPAEPIKYKKLGIDVSVFSFFSVNPFNISKGENTFLPTVEWVSESYNWVLILEMHALAKH